MPNPSKDVLVVGAGPTGLTLASELYRHGVACRVVDELPAPATVSKAAVVHARTMEIFEDMGLADAIVAHAKLLHGLSAFAAGERVAHVRLAGTDSRFRYPHGVSQRDTESALTSHLATLGGVVERGTRVVALEHSSDGVEVTFESGEQTEFAWVIGCDGAHSVVRKESGCTFEGDAYEERLIQADVHLELPDATPDDEILAFLHEDGPLALFPLFKDGRYRVIVLQPSGSPDLEPTLDVFQRVLDERGPAGAKATDPAWMIGFRIHHRQTDRYRTGRALLAGDAAHIHSPVGGQGMNTGIQDAYNLAWKLALVLRGGAHESLLDSYEAERQPVAKALVNATDRAMHGLELAFRLHNPIATRLRNQLLSFATSLSLVQERAEATLSMLAVSYRTSPIVRQDRTPIWQASLVHSGDSDAPSLADWAAFGDAPRPGDRAIDAPLASGTDRSLLFDLFRATRHVALLFWGAGPHTGDWKNVDRIAGFLRGRVGAWIDVHVVVPSTTRPEGLSWDGSVVFDAEGTAHRAYGARSECLFLVRPDGYVAYRALPPDEGRLHSFLATIFREA